jgi:hypothetical protein
MTTGRIPSVEGGIQPTIIDAAGDLIYGASNDTPAILAIGTAGQVLTVNSGATAPEWSTPSAPAAPSFTLLNTGGTALTGATTITVSGISGVNTIYVIVDGASTTRALGSTISLRLNTDTGNNYYYWGPQWKASDLGAASEAPGSAIQLGRMSGDAASVVRGGARIEGANTTGLKMITGIASGNNTGGATNAEANANYGYYDSASTISSISLVSSSENFDAGTLFVYGA